MQEIPSLKDRDQQIEEVTRLAEALESSEDEEFITENLPDFLNKLETTLGIKLTNDVGELYALMQDENCLGRIEQISKIIKALEKEIPFEIGEGDSHYANAVISELEGIKLAFGEGQAPGPVRIMIGFGKTLLGFKTDHISVCEVEFAEDDPRDIESRRYLCRHVDGSLSKEDIRTVVMRIPRKSMVKGMLFEDEKESTSPFIFRGFSI